MTEEHRQHTEPGQGGRWGGGVYRHHSINEQDSRAVLMNEGASLSFDGIGWKGGPPCELGPSATPNGLHFHYQLIKQPNLHPSLGLDPNNGSSQC